MDSPQQYPTMWTTGYLKNGMKVSFTFPIRNEMEACKQALDITNKLLADGFLMTEPGLEVGEVKEQVGYVSRRQKKNDDNTITPIIDVYSPNEAMKFKFISVYLNTPEDISDFENASGHKVSSLPLVPGKAALDKSDDSESIIRVGQLMHIVMKPNPYFDPNEKEISKMKPKHSFVRWESATPTPQPSAPTAATAPAVAAGDDWEVQERIKAQTALNNELVTIFKVRYEPTQNGMGVERWTATARVLDGGMIPITIFGEDAAKITKEGYVWPKTDGDNLSIPVITELRGKDRRITYVEPLESQPDANTNVWDATAWVKVMAYCKAKGINVKDALGVSKGGEWKRGYKDAIQQIDAFVGNGVGMDFMADMPKASGQ